MDWRMLAWLIVVAVFLILPWAVRSLRSASSGDASAGFARTRRNGYATENVDELLNQVYAQPDTAEGRAEALKLIGSARFHLDRTGGYQPVAVDRFLDSLTSALTSGAGLPPRPGVS